jgi:hypothetical protein
VATRSTTERSVCQGVMCPQHTTCSMSCRIPLNCTTPLSQLVTHLELDEAACIRLVVQALVVLKGGDHLQHVQGCSAGARARQPTRCRNVLQTPVLQRRHPFTTCWPDKPSQQACKHRGGKTELPHAHAVAYLVIE